MLEITSEDRSSFLKRYKVVRGETLENCRNLKTEDFVIQPASYVSPPKWHLAHTTWFFEKVLLCAFQDTYTSFDPHYDLLFNSYYKAAGRHWIQSERGNLSRPTVDEVMTYRKHVDECMSALIDKISDPSFFVQLEIGLQHEQQHQELLLMDIKYIFATNPMVPAFSEGDISKEKAIDRQWVAMEEGVYEIGHQGKNFAFDNEGPRHKHYQHAFKIQDQLVSNIDYVEFVESGGYKDPSFWLSLGWDWVQREQIQSPLYWVKKDDQWFEFTMHGLLPLDPNRPVSHVSYFEAQAFARWKCVRLPTEQELELYLLKYQEKTLQPQNDTSYLPNNDQTSLQLWNWTQSSYGPYPGFQEFEGMAKEYNGKFMCNQYVLKGGCLATPNGHYRHTYRNFYQPEQRWMFSGIRLAKDAT